MNQMQKETADAEKGRLSQPYNYHTDNHYELNDKADIRLYRLKIIRRGMEQFNVDVFEVNGQNEHLRKERTDAPAHGEWMTIEGALPMQDLNIKSNGDPGTLVEFSVGNKDALDFAAGDFSWKSDQNGTAGPMCSLVSEVNNFSITEQYFTCDFPVLARPTRNQVQRKEAVLVAAAP